MDNNLKRKKQGEGPPRKDGLPRKTNCRTNDQPGGRKASNETVQMRVEECAHLLVPGMKSKTEIHHIFRKRHGLSQNTIDLIYIPRAQKWLAERAQLSPNTAKRLGINVLFDVLKSGTERGRLKAERRLSEIFGYNSASKHEITGASGGPIATKDETPLPQMTRSRLMEIAGLKTEPERNEQTNGH